jgi:hypothetical protein
MKLNCSDVECPVLTHRILDKPWMTAKFSDDVAGKLLDGLTRLRMSETDFSKIFNAYRAKGSASGEQAFAIAAFERELLGGAGPFSDAGVASGNPCSAFALFSECRANDNMDDSDGDGTLGDQWDGLSQEVKMIYAEVARNIVVGKQLSDLKMQVEAKCTEQAAQGAPPQEEQQAGPLAAAAAAAANNNARAPDSDAAAAGQLQPLPQELEPAGGQQPQEVARDQVQGQHPFSLYSPLSLSLSLYLSPSLYIISASSRSSFLFILSILLSVVQFSLSTLLLLSLSLAALVSFPSLSVSRCVSFSIASGSFPRLFGASGGGTAA